MKATRPAIAIVLLAMSILLGGASAGGYLANLMLQVAAIAVLIGLTWIASEHWPREAAQLVMIAVGVIGWVVLTLIPLPPSLWAALPGREPISRGFDLLALAPPWMPLSLAPLKTLAAVVSMLPPLAIFLVAVGLSQKRRLQLVIALLALAAVSCIFGLMQLVAGPDTSLRFYEITSNNRAVGFFANGNFFVTLMLCALPCAGAAYAELVQSMRSRSARKSVAGAFVALCALFLVGIVVNGSVAGYILTIPAVAASYALARPGQSILLRPSTMLIAILVSVAGLGASVALSSSADRLTAKFSDSPSSRRTMTATTLDAAVDNLPFGTGLGSFQEVYRSHEPHLRATTTYINHAHNDYAELLLELGLPGVAFMGFFIWWWAQRALLLARSPPSPLAQAGIVIVGLVLVHSLVDYPARTSAIAAVIGLACALATSAPHAKTARKRRSADDDRQLDLVSSPLTETAAQ